MPGGDGKPSVTDTWIFRLAVGAVAFGAVAAGGRYGGRYLHDQEAWTKAHQDRPPGYEGTHQMALEVSQGWRDTPTYEEFRTDLNAAEQAAAKVVPHPVEKHGPLAAGIAAALGILVSGEAARGWARKRAAQRALRSRG